MLVGVPSSLSYEPRKMSDQDDDDWDSDVNELPQDKFNTSDFQVGFFVDIILSLQMLCRI